MSEPLIPVPGRLHSVATEGHLAGANEIIDDNLGEVQSVINARYDQKLDLIINDIDQSREMILDKLDDIEELDNYYTTSYVIDQRNNIGLPDTFIRKNIASKDAIKTIKINEEDIYVDVIKRIWANTKLCVGLYDSTNGVLKCKEISREDKSLYADGTSVSISSSDEYDVFMKLPEFYWVCEELDTDIYEIKFTTDIEHTQEHWHYHSGDTFIGVYKGFINNNKLYSKPNVTPTVNQSMSTFRNSAKNKSANNEYDLITYDSHRIMALLGFGWINSTDEHAYIGAGTSNYPKTTGLCDSLGIVDGENQSVNFWGLENWWGDIFEFMPTVRTHPDTDNVVQIFNRDDTLNRNVTCHGGIRQDNVVSKMELGVNGDLLPKEYSSISTKRCYSDSLALNPHGGYITSRSGTGNNENIGLVYIAINGLDMAYEQVGSRLEYKGNYEFVESFV